MKFRERILIPLVVAAATVATSAAMTVAATSAEAASSTLCNSQTASVAGGAYTVENNEWNSSASECVTTDGNADFTVANSAINLSGGAPGGYPAIYKGCHWGSCTTNSSLPVSVGAMTPGKVLTSWSTNQTYTGAYDVAYDIWYNQTPTTSGQPNAEEMMIWINHTGGVEPAGSVVASNVSIGGNTYTVWEDRMSSWNDVSYVLNSGTTAVSNLDVDLLAADSVQRGYMNNSDYLIDLEAGFELWQGGVGLATNSYSVNIGSGTTPPPPSGATGPITGYEGLCLDDRAASTALLNPVQVYTCNGTNAQNWTVASGNTLQVLGMCLDVDAAGTANGTTVDLYTCNGTAAQVWVPQSNGSLLNPNSGKCLDDTGYGEIGRAHV